MIDYHIHTPLCGHANGSLKEYIDKAVDLRLEEIGFADHFPLLHKCDPSLTMSLNDLDDYFTQINTLKKTYPQLFISVGIEADFVPGWERELKNLLTKYSFDFIIGSVHFLNGWGFDDPRYLSGYEGRDIDQLYQHYFETLINGIRSGLFDILGHADLIKVFGFRPSRDITPLYEQVCEAVSEVGMCVEVNTAGLRKPVKEIYPAFKLLTICARKDIPVTLGSDAHRPEDVGRDLKLALDFAAKAGIKKIAIFRERKQHLFNLEEFK
jgi:histidinol-phosphatase (PHP family)